VISYDFVVVLGLVCSQWHSDCSCFFTRWEIPRIILVHWQQTVILAGGKILFSDSFTYVFLDQKLMQYWYSSCCCCSFCWDTLFKKA